MLPRCRGAAALVLALAWAGLIASPVTAQTHAGACADERGVTVVVDYQELGGGTVVRCVTDFTGGTPVQALQSAGFKVEGVLHYGTDFLCRVDGRPAVDEDLDVGGRTHHETCAATPPAEAYWGYWRARAGSAWSFSNAAVSPGEFVGVSFSLNHPKDSPPPRVSTARGSGASPAPPAPRATPALPPGPSVAQPTSRQPLEPRPRNTKATPRPTPRPTQPGPATSVGSPEPTPSASPSTIPTDGAAASGSASAASQPASGSPTVVAAPVEGPGPGPGAGTWVGVGLAGLAAAAAGGIWWRRRRTTR